MTGRAGAALLTRAAPALLLAACIDHDPAGKPADEPGPDTAHADTGTESGVTSPEEVCDGLDNNGDGGVDEGFGDVDADAVADCVDTECAVALAGAEAVSDGSTCTHDVAPAVEPWAVEVLWELDLAAYCLSVVAADLFADGDSEIACVNWPSGRLQIIDGTSGRLIRWDIEVAGWTGLAVANLDADAELEIVAYSQEGTVLALNPDGSTLWESRVVLPEVGSEVDPIEVYDLDGDGSPEVVGKFAVLRGTDGRVLDLVASALQADEASTEELAIGDVDADGATDIFSEWARYRADGSLVWAYAPIDDGHFAANPLLVQADGDEDAEIVLSGDDFFTLLEPDGTIIAEQSGGLFATVPCAGDIDGDGDTDLVVMGSDGSQAWSLPGTLMWEGPYEDITEAWVGCTTFDFDLDGAKEVIYGDEDALFILDGTTGAVLYQHARFSPTLDDRVLVVDLDGDGSVEIVSTTGAGGDGPMLRVYGNVNRDWPPGAQMWPSATWSGTSLLPDGRVPRTPHKPWLTTKVWRGQPETPVFGADLRPAIGETCVASCEDDGQVRVEVRLENLGPDEVESGAPLAVYGLDGAGGRVLLQVLTLPEWLDDGRAAPSWEVVTTTEQAKRGLVFVAGDDGTGSFVPDDCETANNEVAWALEACP